MIIYVLRQDENEIGVLGEGEKMDATRVRKKKQ